MSVNLRSFPARRKSRARFASRRALLPLAVATVLGACTEPRYRDDDSADAAESAEVADTGATESSGGRGSDGGTQRRAEAGASEVDVREPDGSGPAGADATADPPSDAGPPADAEDPSPGFPDWAPQLRGEFALRIFNFAQDEDVVASGVQTLFAKIEKDGTDYQMTALLCAYTVDSTLTHVRVAHPTGLPPRRYSVAFRSDSFAMDPLDTTLGYVAEAPPECNDRQGQAVTMPSGETCRCGVDVLPQADDCRVIDSDGDGVAGYTLIGQALSFGESEVYGVTSSRSKIVRGQGLGSGFVARIETLETFLQHGCRPSFCLELGGMSPACASEQSRVDFIPLAGRPAPTSGSWDCNAVLDRAGELFTELPPAAPASCIH